MLTVVKFGGTSVGSPEKIVGAAKKVKKKIDNGEKVIVVVSAMSGETNKLVSLVSEVSRCANENPNIGNDNDTVEERQEQRRMYNREYDRVISTGELVTIGLMSVALQRLGVKSKSFSGDQAGIKTSNDFTKARIISIDSNKLLQAVNEGYVCVVAGFQGITSTNDVTTIGRSGSDTSAVAVAAAVNADTCEIYTDVDGVYTTDPRIVPTAKHLKNISHEEMLEFASNGAKVLHSRSLEIGMTHNVDIKVLSSFVEEPIGTTVTNMENLMEKLTVSGVAYEKNQARISLQGFPRDVKNFAELFKALAESKVNIDMIVENDIDDKRMTVAFSLANNDVEAAKDTVSTVANKLGYDTSKIYVQQGLSKVSIIGVGMRSHYGVAAAMFETLANSNIDIKMTTTSEIKISVLVEEKYTELAVREIHEKMVENPNNSFETDI